MTGQSYSFGPFCLQSDSGCLLRGNKTVRLGTRAIEILTALLEKKGEVATNQELISRGWPTTFVDESNLRVQITAIRRALRDREVSNNYITNVPGRGYRFSAPVNIEDSRQFRECAKPHLPNLLTELIGRQDVFDDVLNNLSEHRFISIVGPGGIGKTSIALAVGHKLVEEYDGRVYFVDLTSITSGTSVADSVAAALQLSLMSEPSDKLLAAFFRNRHSLLILDNCEQIVADATREAELLLRNASGLHIICTSREPLRGEGEFVYWLPALAAPPVEPVEISARVALQYPAVQLFISRAKSVVNEFDLTDADAPTLGNLCRRLDGIPLAIELAAARVDVFSISELCSHLESSLSVLSRGRRTAELRHRTLRATLDWSFNLLTPIERLVLSRLSVFRSGFSRRAAAEVAVYNGISADQVTDALTSLAAKSLLATRYRDDSVVYRLLETTRAYASEKLAFEPCEPATRLKHLLYCKAESRRIEAKGVTADAPKLDEYRSLIEEIRPALHWAFSEGGNPTVGTEVTQASTFIWYQLSLLEQYGAQANLALRHVREQIPPLHEVEMQLLSSIGSATYNTIGPTAEVRAVFERSIKIACRERNSTAQAWATRGLWQWYYSQGQYGKALELVYEFGQLLSESQDPLFYFKRIEAITRLARGELHEAQRILEDVLSKGRSAASTSYAFYDYEWTSFCHALLSRIHWLRGEPKTARSHAELAAQSALSAQHPLSTCFVSAISLCPIALWDRDIMAAKAAIQVLQRQARQYGLGYWYRFGEVYAQALSKLSPSAAEGLDLGDSSTWFKRHDEEYAAFSNQPSKDDQLARAMSEHPIWCSPEVLRLEAARLHEVGAASESIAMIKRAISIARAQGAKAWEARALADLARIHQADHTAELQLAELRRELPEISLEDFLA